MTVCGFAIGGGLAWAWADAESYDDTGAPTARDVQKLGVAAGELVVVGTGDASIAREIAVTAGQLTSAAPGANLSTLQGLASEFSARKRAYCERTGALYEIETTFGVVLIDSGQIRGLVMRESEDFAARPAEAWSSPGFRRIPQCAADVEAIARGQLDIVRRHCPRATGRALTVAKLGPLGVAVLQIRLR